PAQDARADVVGGTGADRLPGVVPGADILEEGAETAPTAAQQLQLLGQLGQVGREGQEAGGGLAVEPARGAVRGVGAQPLPCAAGVPSAGADSSRWVCALTNPGTIATLPRSRSADRSPDGPSAAIRPPWIVSRPSAIGGPSTGKR